jgi:hypothetical protein
MRPLTPKDCVNEVASLGAGIGQVEGLVWGLIVVQSVFRRPKDGIKVGVHDVGSRIRRDGLIGPFFKLNTVIGQTVFYSENKWAFGLARLVSCKTGTRLVSWSRRPL